MLWLIFVVLHIVTLCKGNGKQDCVFTDSSGSGNTLDLRKFIGHTLTGSDDNNGYRYEYTPCSNGLKCSTETGMNTQMSEESPDICNILSRWDNGTTKPIYDAADGTWRFEYMNGDSC